MEQEVVMNLWLFTQSVTPGALFSDLGHLSMKMQVIYELGVRAYMMSGSDDEMTKLLKELSISEFHLADRFPLPNRYYVQVKEESGQFRASSGDNEPDWAKVMRGVALVRPDISGMRQLEYFTEALDAFEKTLPARKLDSVGRETRTPEVNRRNLLSVITTVDVSEDGTQVAKVETPPRSAAPSPITNLWLSHDERTGAIYSLSGRPYLIHGSDKDKARVLNKLAYDFSLTRQVPIPAGSVRPDSVYSKDLFQEVFATIEGGTHTHSAVNGKTTNSIQITPQQSYLEAMQVNESTSRLTRVKIGRASWFS